MHFPPRNLLVLRVFLRHRGQRAASIGVRPRRRRAARRAEAARVVEAPRGAQPGSHRAETKGEETRHGERLREGWVDGLRNDGDVVKWLDNC